jgi:hypothetical protein
MFLILQLYTMCTYWLTLLAKNEVIHYLLGLYIDQEVYRKHNSKFRYTKLPTTHTSFCTMARILNDQILLTIIGAPC